MQNKKKIALLYGGGGGEHEISEVSSQYVEKIVSELNSYDLQKILLDKDLSWKLKGQNMAFNPADWDAIIPCFHGFPGETGDVQSWLEITKTPYLGCGPEASRLCFNKVTSKLRYQALGVPTAEFHPLFNKDYNKGSLEKFFDQHQKVFVKAASQGSSVGCYPVEKKSKLHQTVEKSFAHSENVLVEKTVRGRELEVAVFEYKGEVIATHPGEIACPNQFYSYEEKYDQKSETITHIKAPGITAEVERQLRQYSIELFKNFGLRHLCRIDFFLTEQNQILLNEMNTFPGLTSISMFPKMMEAHGITFKDFLVDCLESI